MIEQSELIARTGPSVKRGQSRQDYATPKDFMDAVTRRFGPIGFDLAAGEENKKADRFYSIEDDSLSKPWNEIRCDGWLWLNPPFDNIAPWAKKCAESMSGYGCNILFLTPASVGSNWFRDYVHGKAMVYALNGRIHFDPNNPTWGYPKDCMLCCYAMIPIRGFEVWKWK